MDVLGTSIFMKFVKQEQPLQHNKMVKFIRIRNFTKNNKNNFIKIKIKKDKL